MTESLSGPLSDVIDAVGPRLRSLRLQRGATLAQLSATTGLSVSTLSRLESGGRRPTLELLLPLARAHQVQLDELVDAPATGDPRIHPKPVVRNGMTFVPLGSRRGGMQAYKLLLPPHHPTTGAVQQAHEGYEWLYVLSGRVRLRLGAQDVDLVPGEVAEFDTRIPHALSNDTAGVAEVLVLFGPQGERMHVRARPTRATGG